MSPLDTITSELIGASHGKSPGSDNFNFFEPGCSLLSSGRACKTVRSDCGGAVDEDDLPCVIAVSAVRDV